MDTPYIQAPGNSTASTDVESEFCVVSVPANYTSNSASNSTNWIKRAVTQTPRKKRQSTYPRAWQIKPRKLPDWLTEPAAEPVAEEDDAEPLNPAVSEMRQWYQNWRNRDWEETHRFFRDTDPDNDEPKLRIIKIADLF